jgi:hypothetical protein
VGKTASPEKKEGRKEEGEGDNRTIRERRNDGGGKEGWCVE